MMVRRYVVKDMPEAVVLIRRDLGKDAVILSTKRIRVKKWLGIWRQKRIEVMAAASSDVPVRTSVSPFRDTIKETASTEARSLLHAHPTNTEPNVSQSSTGMHDAIHPSLKSPGSGHTITFDGGEQTSNVGIVRVLEDIAEMKKMLESALVSQDGIWASMIQHLRNQGMSEHQIMTLIREREPSTLQREEMLDFSTEVLTTDMQARILERLGHMKDAQPISPESRIVAFVGPTGVGKTTTVAKLAALHVLAGKRKVGLVTTDTFRIAAVEQLRTYAGILNIPLEVVHQPSEMQVALERLVNCDLILIDTAGRNFALNNHLQEIQNFLQVVDVDETFLVLSLTSKPKDLDALAASFCRIPVDKFLFTKLDETSTYGAILDLLLTYEKPISYVTTGQNVPDDIEVASLEKLLDLIVGGAA